MRCLARLHAAPAGPQHQPTSAEADSDDDGLSHASDGEFDFFTQALL